MEKEDVFQISDGDFKKEVLLSDRPVLVDFWAPRCGPCLRMAPVIDELAKEYSGSIKVVKMNVDKNLKVPSALGIRSIPTLILFENGNVVDRIVGAVPESSLRELIEQSLKYGEVNDANHGAESEIEIGTNRHHP